MSNSICGIDCSKCEVNEGCQGCAETKGHPFGGECVIAECCNSNNKEDCNACTDAPCMLKEKLIAEFNALGIKDMAKITDLNALKGSFVNIEYTLLNGQKIKLLNDEKIYLGNQICKESGDRCYGLVADESHLLVCEYGIDGADAEIIVYRKRMSF